MALSGTGSVASSSQVNVANAAGTFDISGTTAGATIKTLNGVANSNVTLGSQTLTIANGSTTYAGVIGGTGGLSLTAGTQTLTGANTYTGVTTINGGTLQIGNGGTTGSVAGNIVDNAALVFNLSNALTYSGTISGTGTLTQSGTGTLTLSGINTYGGVTTINGGTLALSGAGSVAASSQVNVANAAGTFDISGTTAGATITTLNGVANSNVTLGSQTLTICERVDHLCRRHRRHRRIDPDGGHPDPDRRQHLHRRNHDQRRHAGAERDRQRRIVEPGERGECRRHV